jgi:glycosyltransferase involved in cell wall biosynthesis
MKIAICIDQASLGGVGTSTYILARGFREAGHRADILGTHWAAGDDYQRAQRDGWPVEAICAGQRWLRRRLRTVHDRLAGYDVVINNNILEPQLVLPALPPRIIRLSVVRSTDASVIRTALRNSPWLDSLVGISPAVTQLLQDRRPGCPVATIANAVLVESASFPALSASLNIVFLGRLAERQKNILILSDIATELDRLKVEFTLRIVGDGPQRTRLEKKLRRAKLGRRVVLCGAMRREDAWKALTEAHFSLIPSRYEGFGLVLAESMAAGAVPVASNLPVFQWIAGSDAESLLVPVGDARAYAERIRALSSDPARYLALQKRLRERQKQFFAPKLTVNNYLKLIEEIRKNRDHDKFTMAPLEKVPLGSFQRVRCSRPWLFLQYAKATVAKRN